MLFTMTRLEAIAYTQKIIAGKPPNCISGEALATGLQKHTNNDRLANITYTENDQCKPF